MPERAHPDHPDFQDRWIFRLRRGFIPWVTKYRNPYRAGIIWRYKWADQFCVNKNVLDVPCGMGWGSSLLRSASSITGVDIDPEAIREARERYASSRIKFEVGNMTSLVFPNDSFDVVCCLEGIEHITKEASKSFIQESWRLLKSDGLLLLSSPYCTNKSHSGNPFHIYEYQPDEIRNLVGEKYFVEEEISRQIHVMTVLYLRCRKKPV